MSRPRFSIVIPARDRAHTLRFTLRTCLAQNFDDFEIIVADNCSSEPVRVVAEECRDARVVYVRSETLLAMSDSWEYALAQAKGEYVTLLGNDDGLLLHALPEIDRLLRTLDTPVLRWECVCYNWPDLPPQEHASPHELLIPLKQRCGHYAIHRHDSIPMMQAAANSRISYSELPMIYCSAIHHTLIERLRSQTGRVFRSRSPDVFSSFALAYLAGSYYSVEAPMSINGLSGQSNGVACIYLNGASPVAEEFHRLNSAAAHVPHAKAPDALVMPAGVADSFLHARDLLFANDPRLTLDRKQLVVNCIAAARLNNEPEWCRYREGLRRSVRDDAELSAWFDSEYGQRSFENLPRQRVQLKRYSGEYMHLDASQFGVANILEAAELCEKLLGGKNDGLNCHLIEEPGVVVTASPAAPVVTASTPESVTELQWVENALAQILCELIPTPCMIDVGAHFGTSLEPFHQAGWHVVAFEPIEANRQTLLARFHAADRLTVRPEAVSNESGTKAFHLALNLDGTLHEYHHSLEEISEDPWHRKGPTIEVPTVSLDDLVARGDLTARVGFLKIDTEGHDLAVLQGGASLECDVVCVEFWGDQHALGKSPSPAGNVIDLMHRRGYRSFLVLCHDGDAITALESTLAGMRPDSWGNIFFFKDDQLYRRLIQHPEWRLVIDMAASCHRMKTELRAKEAVIQELVSAENANRAELKARQQVIQGLDVELQERATLIQQLNDTVQSSFAALEAKEQVIQDLKQGLETQAAAASERLKVIDQLLEILHAPPPPPPTAWQKLRGRLNGLLGQDGPSSKDAA